MTTKENGIMAGKAKYDGLRVRQVNVAPQGVLCASAAGTDGVSVTGSWFSGSTNL